MNNHNIYEKYIGLLDRAAELTLCCATTFYHNLFLEYRKKDKENKSEDVIDYKGNIFLTYKMRSWFKI